MAELVERHVREPGLSEQRGKGPLAQVRRVKKNNQRMPVIFASADITDRLVYYAMLSNVEVDETDSTTKYEFTDLKQITGDLPLSSLKLQSTNRPLSDDYIRPYAICHTPSFIS